MPARILADREPESNCSWCAAVEDEPCEGACRCPDCESERELADATEEA